MRTNEQLAGEWSRRAEEWDQQIGPHGDRNRQHQLGPALWPRLQGWGDKRVLDAGCGTGWLAIKLAQLGATVTAVDFAPGGRGGQAQCKTTRCIP